MIRPTYLKRGDTVAITALASKIDYDRIIPPAIATLKEWGLKVVEGKSLKSEWFTFAGDDEIRQRDYQKFLDDPSIKAIFSARGGYGCSRYLENIDYTAFQKHPKWIIGFSDITTVLCDLYEKGYESIHGTMPKVFFQDPTGHSLVSLRKLLFGEPIVYQTSSTYFNRYGEAKGILVGGNLCMFVHTIGTVSEINTDGKILFLEEVDEFHYSIDRFFVQLKRTGKLDKLAGLIIGSFSGLRDKAEDFGFTVEEIITHWTKQYSFPVAFGFPVGHEAGNLAMPVGREVVLTVNEEGVKLEIPNNR